MARKIVVIDSETDPFKKGRLKIRPFIWGIFDGSDFTFLKETADVEKFFKNENFVVYAHNGGKFDYHFLFDFVNTFEPITVINSRIAKMRIGNSEFRDSYSIIPLPLSAYKKDEINYDIMEAGERDKPENDRAIRKYLKSDLIYLYDLVKSFIENYGVHLTLASAAFAQWRKITGNKNPKTTANFYETIHPFYYGGRVQAFKLGIIKEKFYVYDVNSAYPRAMLEDHPYGDNFLISSKIPNKNIELCFIKLKCASTGCFPFRTQNGLYFPNDGEIREFCITGYEFLMADKLKLIRDEKILEVLIFSEKINFKQYVDYFFRKKQHAEENKDAIKRNEAKLFLNGLYGKFAANPSEYREFMCVDPQYINGAGVDGWFFNSMFGKYALLYRNLPPEKQNYYNVATGASITGYQRAVMMEAINNVKNPLYCDTDSIVCYESGRLRCGPNLGQWKEEAVCNYGAIAGKKLYTFQRRDGTYKSASKGVRLTPREIIRIAQGEEIESQNEAPTFTLHKEPFLMSRKIKMKKELQTI